MTGPELTRPEVAAQIGPLGWRVIEATLAASVPVPTLEHGLGVAAQVASAAHPAPPGVLRIDVRHDRVELVVRTMSRRTRFSPDDVDVARRISARLDDLGTPIAPAAGTDGGPRPVQGLEIAIDALDIPAIRPFWRAVLGYGDEPGGDGATDAVVDPVQQGPTIWFQQMDEPRPQRNRIHFDVIVAEDEAERRIAAALAAGGRLIGDAEAKAFWVLADAEGNEICVCTWQDRD